MDFHLNKVLQRGKERRGISFVLDAQCTLHRIEILEMGKSSVFFTFISVLVILKVSKIWICLMCLCAVSIWSNVSSQWRGKFAFQQNQFLCRTTQTSHKFVSNFEIFNKYLNKVIWWSFCSICTETKWIRIWKQMHSRHWMCFCFFMTFDHKGFHKSLS